MINFNIPFVSGDEVNNLKDLIQSGGPFYGSGKFNGMVTQHIVSMTGSENIIATDSCTSALDVIALLLSQRCSKRTILCPSYTFSSTASAFIKAGFNVEFIDINPQTLMVDLKCLNCNDLSDVAALVVVHYAGQLCDLIELKEFCSTNNIFLVEDAAQAYGCKFSDRHAGTFGDYGAFSFHETKNIHCGLGGALVVKGDDAFRSAKYICDRGSNRTDMLKGLVDKYTWVALGGSYTLSEISAAFLAAQLSNYENFLSNRKSMWFQYHGNLKNQDGMLIPNVQSNVVSNYHAFYSIFESEEVADLVRNTLLSDGIQAYIGYVPLHLSPFAVGSKNCYCLPLPNTEDVSKRILRLPLHYQLTISEVDRICRIIKSCNFKR